MSFSDSSLKYAAVWNIDIKTKKRKKQTKKHHHHQNRQKHQHHHHQQQNYKHHNISVLLFGKQAGSLYMT